MRERETLNNSLAALFLLIGRPKQLRERERESAKSTKEERGDFHTPLESESERVGEGYLKSSKCH